MAKYQKAYFNYLEKLDQRELDLIRQKKAVATFLAGEHSIEQAKKLLDDLRKAECELASSLEDVVKTRTATYFRKEAEKICARGREINEHAKDIDRMLATDLLALASAAKKEKVDVQKNTTFLLTIPGFLLGVAKSGIASNHLGPYQALALGFAISSGLLLRKRILGAFRDAGRSLCAIPKEARESFTLYYMREITKEKGREIVLFLGMEPKRQTTVQSSGSDLRAANRNEM